MKIRKLKKMAMYIDDAEEIRLIMNHRQKKNNWTPSKVPLKWCKKCGKICVRPLCEECVIDLCQ